MLRHDKRQLQASLHRCRGSKSTSMCKPCDGKDAADMNGLKTVQGQARMTAKALAFGAELQTNRMAYRR